MHLKSAHFKGFKRFTDAQLSGIPPTARLVVLAGPNGSGKSSVFDGFQTWYSSHGAVSGNWDETYGTKHGQPAMHWPERVTLEFHEPLPTGQEDQRKLLYVRTAFRNEADFSVNNFARMSSPLDQRRIWKLIDNDASVSENYQRLIMQTIDGVYDDELPDEMTRVELRDRIIGEVRQALSSVFPDLTLSGVGGIGSVSASVGTFYFTKGASTGFLYKNLSAGEKAVFDLLLDLIIKREYYDDSIWCIDEPETHLNTRVQGAVLEALLENLPPKCQLFLASHSIGFMRKAWEIAQLKPEEVCFVDMNGIDFDAPVVVEPVRPTRRFWSSTLDVALGDMAGLVAPEHLVLCEGRPPKGATDNKAAFDAACYQTIFVSEFPNTDFVSVGNSDDVSNDRLEFGLTFQTLVTSTRLTRLVDRDTRSELEVQELHAAGIRVLSRRHLEAYLLDDEVMSLLCTALGQPDKVPEALTIKQEELAASVERGNDPDDHKSAAGTVYVRLRKSLGITGGGSTWHAFARDTLAPLIKPGTAVYGVLREDVFGDV